MWQKLLGGSAADQAWSVQQTADGGYIVAGYSSSSASGDVTGTTHGLNDYWVVKLLENAAPTTPTTPTGPTSGLVGTSYSYSTSATDPDGDQLTYTFDWGDATTTVTSAVAPGTPVSQNHTWIISRHLPGQGQWQPTSTESHPAGPAP